ncbi:hypothetical protein [Cypionkella psychrotolerans]|uniref:hypothetical protein n=1 Tax=Cypionkella psychrotolerans TaxID=1678131 RepID=UPI0006B4C0E4|nr:hypothetical protein [Cypionkella psychrotolerans]
MNAEVKKSARINVKVEANLFEADIPLVVLLSKKAGTGTQHFIASAIPDESGEVDYYFVVFVGRHHLIRYFNEQCDLRFLFAFASGRKYYVVKDLKPNTKGAVALEEFQGVLGENLLPDGQFFVTAHTSKYGISDAIGKEQRLLIDGHWDMQEFGSFYQKFADLYSYSQAVEYISDPNSQKISQVQKAFSSKPFKGGSSYMGFFNDLFEIIPSNQRPSLEGIEYHSPGWVDLRGKDEILEAVKVSVELFLEGADAIQKAHDDLRGFMSKAKLLSITGGLKEVSSDVLIELLRLTKVFYELLPVVGKDQLKSLTKDNPIVHAKVGLALFRRLRATAHFFAQGRLAYSE